MKLKHEMFEFNLTDENLTKSEVESLKNWCEAMLSPKRDIAMALDMCGKAVTALTVGMFKVKSSKEHWSKGFEVNSERCLAYEEDNFYSIYDPDTCELDVYDGDVSARIDVRTGHMVMM